MNYEQHLDEVTLIFERFGLSEDASVKLGDACPGRRLFQRTRRRPLALHLAARRAGRQACLQALFQAGPRRRPEACPPRPAALSVRPGRPGVTPTGRLLLVAASLVGAQACATAPAPAVPVQVIIGFTEPVDGAAPATPARLAAASGAEFAFVSSLSPRSHVYRLRCSSASDPGCGHTLAALKAQLVDYLEPRHPEGFAGDDPPPCPLRSHSRPRRPALPPQRPISKPG